MKIENKSDTIGIEHCYLCGKMIVSLYRYYKEDKPICKYCLNEILYKLSEELSVNE